MMNSYKLLFLGFPHLLYYTDIAGIVRGSTPIHKTSGAGSAAHEMDSRPGLGNLIGARPALYGLHHSCGFVRK